MSTIQSISNSANSSYSTSKVAQSAQSETPVSVTQAGSGSGSTDATKALKVEEITRKNNNTKSVADVSADVPEKDTSNDFDQINEALKRAVDEINKNASNSEAQFAVHEGTHRIMIKIVDKDTKEVIKEFPPEKTLDMIAKAWELAGLTIDERR